MYNGRKIYVEIDSNRDGSQFATEAYYLDGEMEVLTEKELDEMEADCQDEINGHHWT
jgi:hypothetical protein